MIRYKTGDLLREEAEAIVNTVNCVGVMGKGIALQFKKKFPDNFKSYEAACKRGDVVLGKMYVHKPEALLGPKYVINFPTKRHWRGKSRMEDIESGLQDLAEIIKELDIKSIAIPPLGCGLGGLVWDEVKGKIEHALGALGGVSIVVFEPEGAPEASTMAREHKKPNMTEGRAALISLMKSYLSGFLDTSISLLEVHKLMYFLQESGEPLRLKYEKDRYGPYAENLGKVLNKIEGYWVLGYGDAGDDPKKELTLINEAIKESENFLQDHPKIRSRCDKVAELVEGFETSFGMELLSTVHWVVKSENLTFLDEIVKSVYDWNERKKKFTKRQIGLAYQVLCEKGWIEAQEQI